MLVDARKLPSGETFIADVCIIGGGAAGIAMALELADECEVILLESGGLTSDPVTQNLYSGENVGLDHAPPHESRSRFLGGSTNCWGGWCRPLDDIDFEERPWVANSGWPIRKNALAPYLDRAHGLMELPEAGYDLNDLSDVLAERKAGLLPLDGTEVANVLSRLSPPTRFGTFHHAALHAAERLRVLLYANAIGLSASERADHVDSATVKTLADTEFTVKARQFVLAAGGIENARLLLASNDVQSEGLGNGNDVVGRYYMDHPRLQTSRISLNNPHLYRALYDATLHRIHRGRGNVKRDLEVHLAPSPEAQRRHQLPNSRTYLVARHGNDLTKSFIALRAVQRALVGRRQFGYPLSRVAKDLVAQVPTLLRHMPTTMATVMEVRLNAISPRNEFSLETVIEPIPNPDSRVTLSERRDRLGMPKVKVDWRLTEQDHQHFRRLDSMIVEALETTGAARSLPDDRWQSLQWPDEVQGCWHHMSTTRMSEDPRSGVVDANCRVHGIDNLHIAGSSVFPTVGSDSPTINLVALALRLADRLRDGLRNELPTQNGRAFRPAAE